MYEYVLDPRLSILSVCMESAKMMMSECGDNNLYLMTSWCSFVCDHRYFIDEGGRTKHQSTREHSFEGSFRKRMQAHDLHAVYILVGVHVTPTLR